MLQGHWKGAKKFKVPDSWFSAFEQLMAYINASKSSKKKVIFIDEFPWMDTPRSKFLMAFEKEINSSVRFTRLDTLKSVDVFYDISSISFNPKMQTLMQKAISKQASKEELKEFGMLWQNRVEEIASKMDELIKVKL